jgi:predicted small metal-binding protein
MTDLNDCMYLSPTTKASFARTQDEIMEKCAEHAKKVHNITEISPELAAKVKAAIQDV